MIVHGLPSFIVALFSCPASNTLSLHSQTREFQYMSARQLGYTASDILTMTFSVVMSFIFSWRLTLVLLATVPPSAIVLSLISRKVDPAIMHQKECLSEASKHASSSLAAIDLVKVYNGFDNQMWQYLSAIRQAARYYRIQARWNSAQIGFIKMWTAGLFAGGLGYGIVLVNQGASAGSILTAFYSTMFALASLEAILPSYLILAKGASAATWLKKAISGSSNPSGRETRQMGGQQWPPSCHGAIQFNRVGFSYPSNPSKTVLSSLSLSFPPGQVSFVVGSSGSGKSTIGDLLVQFYRPKYGEILIGDTPLSTINTRWIRENITLIQQCSVVFNDTMHMNIALGHTSPDSVTRGAVKDACQAALLQNTVASLPKGYDTLLGAGGASLSGGQMQRLALARAKLRDPPVLILDEVTSGLDQASGALIMEAIRLWRRGKTTLIITHNFSHIEPSDWVVVMEQGSVVQSGVREEIEREAGSVFAQLAQSSSSSSGRRRIDPVPEDSQMEHGPKPPESDGEQKPRPGVEKRPPSFIRSMLFTQDITSQRSRRLGLPSGWQYDAWGKKLWQQPELQPSQRRVYNLEHEEDHGTGMEMMDHKRNSVWPAVKHVDLRMDLDLMLRSASNAQQRRSSTTTSKRRRLSRTSTTGSTTTTAHKSPTAPYKSREHNGGTEEGKTYSVRRIYSTVWPSITPSNRVRLMLAIVTSTIVAASTPIFSFLLANLLAIFSLPKDERGPETREWAGYLALVIGVEGIATYFSTYLFESLAQSWVDALRIEALKSILDQPWEWWHGGGKLSSSSPRSRDKLTSILDRDGEQMRSLLGKSADKILSAAVMTSIAVTWAMIISWKLTMVALAAAPPVLLLSKLYAFVSSKYEALCEEADLRAASVLAETINNVRVVRALTLEQHFADKFAAGSERTYRLGVRMAFLSSPLYGLSESATLFLTALVFYWGMRLLTQGSSSISDVIQVVSLPHLHHQRCYIPAPRDPADSPSQKRQRRRF